MVEIGSAFSEEIDDARCCWLNELVLYDLLEVEGLASLTWSEYKNCSRRTDTDQYFRSTLKWGDQRASRA